MLDRPLPNGKKLRDCRSRDLVIVGHAYAIAAEHLESGEPLEHDEICNGSGGALPLPL
jgi:hypothetical protein